MVNLNGIDCFNGEASKRAIVRIKDKDNEIIQIDA